MSYIIKYITLLVNGWCNIIEVRVYLYCLSKENTPFIFDIVEISPWTVPRPREGSLDIFVQNSIAVVTLYGYAAT